MNITDKQPSTALTPLIYAWLGLVALTLISLDLGQSFRGAAWLQVVVAVIVWLKGMLVARRFLEVKLTHPFIKRLLMAFIAFAPIALILTAFFGNQFARWTTL